MDANKRLAAAAAEFVVTMNRGVLIAGDDELHDLVLAIADGTLSRDDVDDWMLARVRESSSD